MQTKGKIKTGLTVVPLMTNEDDLKEKKMWFKENYNPQYWTSE